MTRTLSCSDVVLLSDGAQPTEAIYFDHVVPFLQREGLTVTRLDARKRSPFFSGKALLEARSALIIVRALPSKWLGWLKKHRSRLGKIFYLVDDDFAAAAADAALPDAYRRRMARLAQRIQPGILDLADEIVVACRHLEQQLAPHHRKVALLTPSLISPLPELSHQTDQRVEIGFHGTRAHLPDLEAVAPALSTTVKNHADVSLELMLGDYVPRSLKSLTAANTPPPLSWQSFLDYQRQHRLQIGIAPLWPTAFNAGKSWIKFLDIAVMGGVGVYSKRAPYSEIVNDGVDGLLVEDSVAAWCDALAYLIDSPEKRAIMAQAAALKACEAGNPAIAREFWLARLVS